MQKAADVFRYNRRVFIASPWPEVYQLDRERKQSFEEAVRTYKAMVATYTASGYELVELPLAPIEQRIQFVLQNVNPRSLSIY